MIGIADSTGNTVARYEYDAWGVCTTTQNNSADIANVNPFRYRGYYYDVETSLYYLQSRYYDPVVERWLNVDRMMGANNEVSTYALFTYCGNNPIDRYDVEGMFWSKIKSGVRSFLKKTNKVLVSIGIDTAAIGAYYLNMTKDRNGIYHANFDCWQQYFGFNDFYDFVFDLCTSMERRKFEFKSGSKWYVLWAWKGNYINLGAGAELGIYYNNNHGPHWSVDKALAMDMSLDLKYRGSSIIKYHKTTWWITGFNPNPKYFDVKASELKVTYTIRFKNTKMYSNFKKEHSKAWLCNNDTKIVKFSF